MSHIKRVPVETGASPTGTTNAYVIRDENECLLIDPPAEAPTLTAAIASHSHTHIVVTHAHPDHIQGLTNYGLLEQTTVWGRRWHTDAIKTATGITPERTYKIGSSLPVAGATVVSLPGHTLTHVGFAVDGTLICGDLARKHSSVAIRYSEGSIRSYLLTLRRLIANPPTQLAPGHGPPIDAVRTRLRSLYMRRKKRESQILAQLDSDPQSINELATAVYDRPLHGVHEEAVDTTRAHVGKLVREDKVMLSESKQMAWIPS